MSKPIVVIWLKGVNLIQENTRVNRNRKVKLFLKHSFHRKFLITSHLQGSESVKAFSVKKNKM